MRINDDVVEFTCDRAEVNKIMDHVGLKDFATTTPDLRGVFERLYQDAVQRVQRYGLIRERMLAANAACSQIVSALSDQQSKDDSEDIPDFERLNTTAQAALRGMWYHTDYLFKATCAYAMSQGVENSLLKVHRSALTDLMDTSEDTDPTFPYDDSRRFKGSRLPDRRDKRANKLALNGGTGRDWHHTASSFAAAASPPRYRKQQLADPEVTSFSQYVAALTESRAELEDDDWLRSKDKAESKANPNPHADTFTTLKAACYVEAKGRGNTGGSGKGLGTSQSLPALPKGRTMFQTESPSSTLNSKFSMASSLALICFLRLAFISLHPLSVFFHSSSRSFFVPL